MPYKDIEKKREQSRNWMRTHYAERREIYAENSRRYQLKNKAELRERRLAQYWKDPDRSRARLRQYQHEHPDAVKSWHLKYKYGITLEDYQRLYTKQSGQCAICGVEFPILGVDHSHESGRVRGLLCQNCNAGLGMLGGTSERVMRAAQYLTHYEREEIWAQETTY